MTKRIGRQVAGYRQQSRIEKMAATHADLLTEFPGHDHLIAGNLVAGMTTDAQVLVTTRNQGGGIRGQVVEINNTGSSGKGMHSDSIAISF